MQNHSLAIKGEKVYIDNNVVRKIRSQGAHGVAFETTDSVIQVNHEELWYAVAGSGAAPTDEEAGRLLAENLVRWYQDLHLRELLQQTMRPYIPEMREDPFVEAALARCEQTPTREKVEALAQVIDQSVDVVIELLRERGKLVAEPPKQEASVEQESPSTPQEQSERFTWTEAMVSQLRTAFLAATEETVKAAARNIAKANDWPESKVSYKIYELGLQKEKAESQKINSLPAAIQTQIEDEPENHQEVVNIQDDSGARLIASAEPEVAEMETIKANLLPLPANKAKGKKQAPVSSLQRGNVLWEVLLAGEQQAQYWGLDYAYGSFPLKGGTIVSYEEQKYLLRVVGVNMLKVAAVGARVLSAAV